MQLVYTQQLHACLKHQLYSTAQMFSVQTVIVIEQQITSHKITIAIQLEAWLLSICMYANPLHTCSYNVRIAIFYHYSQPYFKGGYYITVDGHSMQQLASWQQHSSQLDVGYVKYSAFDLHVASFIKDKIIVFMNMTL